MNNRLFRHHTRRSMAYRIGAFLIAFVAAATLLGTVRADRGLPHSKGSLEALVGAVLGGLERCKREALEALLVTRQEHRDLLWPELPERNAMSFERARFLNERNTAEGLSEAISRFGGQEFELVSIELSDETEVYRTFTLHFVRELRVRRTADGAEGSLPVLDVLLERDGRWKLMNYEE